MLKKYGSSSELTITLEKTIDDIIEKLEVLATETDIYIYYGYPIIDRKTRRDIVKGIIISTSGVIVLYEHPDEKNIFASNIMQSIADVPDLFDKFFSPLREEGAFEIISINDTPAIIKNIQLNNEILSNHEVALINNSIQTAFGLSKSDDREIMNPDSLGSRIKKRNTFVASFDEEQFNTIVGYDNENLRIRGLAGSGKTIILLKKMAYLHYKDRSKNLAIVFYTMSLKQYVLRLFKKFYSDYDKFNQPDMSKIQVLHGWGGKARAGFYSVVCERNDITPKTYGHYKKDKHPLESACSDLLAKLGYRNIDLFDYVLIDEAQDFGINFFRLARKSLTQNGKLIYAYDELQSLNDESIMPSKGEIFESESCRDINLRTSYRAPVEILVTAHAIGLGIYREAQSDGHSVVNIIEDIETWTAIGYEATKGELKEGKYVELERNENLLDNSSQIVNFEKFKSETKQ